jgi:hypothetical protein
LALSFLEQACLRSLVVRESAQTEGALNRTRLELEQTRRALSFVSLEGWGLGEGNALLFAFDLHPMLLTFASLRDSAEGDTLERLDMQIWPLRYS